MEAEWTPRDRNQEADDLSNLLTGGFDPDKEVKLDLRAKLAGTPFAPGSRSEILRAKGFGNRTAEEGGATRRQGEEEERGQTEKQREVVKTAESWKARQQQQYKQKRQEAVRREARPATVFGDLVTHSGW